MLAPRRDLRGRRQRGTGHDQLRSGGDDQARIAAAGTRRVEVTLDATTAPGWEGSPVVYLDGSEAEFEGGTWGIRVRENSTANIYGLGIGEFDLGIWFEPESAGRACGNFVGTDLTGTQPRPNYDGIWVDEGARFVQVGRQCGEDGGGNLVSGNTEWGIVAAGEELEIDRNLVGTDASGEAPLPNGPDPEEVEAEGGGIRVGPNAIEVTVGGLDDQELPHNVIAFNRGPGVLVQNGALFATVRQNSIFANEGPGIESPATTVTAAITSVGRGRQRDDDGHRHDRGAPEPRLRPRVLQQRRMRSVGVRPGPVLPRQQRRRSRNRRHRARPASRRRCWGWSCPRPTSSP